MFRFKSVLLLVCVLVLSLIGPAQSADVSSGTGDPVASADGAPVQSADSDTQGGHTLALSVWMAGIVGLTVPGAQALAIPAAVGSVMAFFQALRE